MTRISLLLPLALLAGPAFAGDEIWVSTGSNKLVAHDAATGAFKYTVLEGYPTIGSSPDLELGPDGLVYVCDWALSSVHRFDPVTATYLGVFVTPLSGGLRGPMGCDFGADGNLYVVDYNNTGTFSILVYDGQTGAYLRGGPTNLTAIDDWGLAFGPDGAVYVGGRDSWSAGMGVVHRMDPATMLGTVFVSAAANNGLESVRGLTWGPDGHLYVSDDSRDVIERYDGATGLPLGTWATLSGSPTTGGTGTGARGVEWRADGTLMVACWDDGVIAKFAANGTFLGHVIGAGAGLQSPWDALEVSTCPDCPAPAGVLVLGGPCGATLTSTAPVQGASATLSFTGGPPSAPGLHLASVPTVGSLPVFGCQAWLNPAQLVVLAPFVTDSNGDASLALPVPCGVCGVGLSFQSFAIASFAPPTFAITNGLTLTVGS